MKPAIRQINDPNNQDELTKLNSFSEKILNNTMLSVKQKEDAIKVINNIKYIKLNIEYIGYCVEHKNDESIYKQKNDKEKGVLRDQDNTSFHINSYYEKDKAVRDHTEACARFEDAIEQLGKVSPHVFYVAVSAFDYNNPIGCINARIEPFYVKLESILTNGLSSFDFAQLFAALFVKNQVDRTISVNDAITKFAEEQWLDDADIVKLREGLEMSYGLDEKDFAGTLHDPFGPASAETIAQAGGIKLHLDKSFAIMEGGAGMIQIWFDANSQQQAASFVEYLHTQTHIPEIGRATARPAQGAFIVRLTAAQARAFNNGRLNEVINQPTRVPVVQAWGNHSGQAGSQGQRNNPPTVAREERQAGNCTIQ